MKILVLAGLAAPLLLASPVSAAANLTPAALSKANWSSPYTYPAYHSHGSQKRSAILAVREEGLALQAADGGKLTEAHRAYLQAKFDAVLRGNY